ncbi:MAG: preprotein translocase subunit SecG [Acidobacteriota bacterium]
MIYLFYMVHVLICLFLILVVLLQQGKGADLSVFGGGGTMTAFGARGAATLLHKMTVFGFVGFIVTTLVIGVLLKEGDGDSVLSGIPAAEEVTATQDEEAAEAEDAAALPEDEPEAAIQPETETFDEGGADEGAGGDGDSSATGDDPATSSEDSGG